MPVRKPPCKCREPASDERSVEDKIYCKFRPEKDLHKAKLLCRMACKGMSCFVC